MLTTEETKRMILHSKRETKSPVFSYGQAMKAMDEFAKFRSIAFIKWVMSQTEWRFFDDKAIEWTDGSKTIVVDELYQLFLKENK